MENFKGTKGKWFLKEKSDGCSTISGEGWEDFCEINTVTDGSDFENKFYNISKANAQLIAHAPEMLELLNDLAYGDISVSEAIEKSKQLIQKATTIESNI